MTCVRSNITQLVDRLEADGLVSRVEDPRDRRSVRAAITPLGRERQAAGARLVQAIRNDVAEALSEIDPDVLERALLRLRQPRLQESDTPASRPPPGMVHATRRPSIQRARSMRPSSSVTTAYAATRMSMDSP
jgi:hypothetical protein